MRSYFGPAGLFADTEDDGWFIAGCLLKKSEEAKPAAKLEAKPEAKPVASESGEK